MNYNIINSNVSNRILTITLNRADKRNALSNELIIELTNVLTLAKENSEIKIIIIKANGEVFSAGADLEYLKQMQSFSLEKNLEDSSLLRNLFQLIYTHPKIIIAQVHGHAIAGGCGLASVCDFIFASDNALFGYTEVGIGFIPALVSFFLIRKIGEAKARHLLLSGSLITAHDAMTTGLVFKVTTSAELELQVNEFATNLCKNVSANSIRQTKFLISEIQSKPMQEALDFASQLNAETRLSDDCSHGIQSFLNKQKPNW